MLETEEVDDDFFTPVAGTSLANIFRNVSTTKENTQNDSLKYIPPKPQNIAPKKKEQSKNSECIYACTVTGHEWFNNVYTSRGRLGLAIMKILKTGEHSIVLYDNNKTTLSCVNISTNLQVTINNKSYISYYDNQQKYWSIYASEDTLQKIADMLKSWDVHINYSTYTDKGPPETQTEIETNPTSNVQSTIESDTDSSINKKTKASILNRIAKIGNQSYLPTRLPPAEESSDSSDTGENVPKISRHKPVKTSVRKTSVDNITYEHHNSRDQKITMVNTDSDKHVAIYSGQYLPLTNTSTVTGTNNELGMFMTEQRVNNSELRINLNRISDKMELALDKLSNLGHKKEDTNVSTDIMLKLLTEYEAKIKMYEAMLKSKNIPFRIDTDESDNASECQNKNNEVELLKSKLSDVEKENTEKSNEILNLQKEIQLLKDNTSQESQILVSKTNDLLMKINTLEDELKLKTKELSDLKVSQESKASNGNSIEEKVKNIMNDTFQTISTNFDNNDNYNGENIKRIIGTVIRKITIQTLSEL